MTTELPYTSTPIFSSRRWALRPRFSPIGDSTNGEPSNSITRHSAGSMVRNAPGRVRLGEFDDLPGQLDPGGSAADHDERQPARAFGRDRW